MKRLSRFAACDARELLSEAAPAQTVEKAAGRTRPVLVLLDSRGRQLTSEEIANFLQYHQSHDTQELLFGVVPQMAWSVATRAAGRYRALLRQNHAAARAGACPYCPGSSLPRLYHMQGHPYHGDIKQRRSCD